MLTNENSQRSKRSAKLPSEMARPRVRPPGTKTVLSFLVDDSLIESLDAAAEELSKERPVGSAKVARSEVVKIALTQWLAARPKPRQQ